MSSGPERSQRLLIASASSIAILAVVEITLRAFTPQDVADAGGAARRRMDSSCEQLFIFNGARGWSMVPDCTVTSSADREYEVTVHSNNHGFRDYKDYRFDRKDTPRRVVVLGDSFGYGNGVEELGRYSNLLDDLLGPNVEVYNLAISNYGLDQALLTLQSEGLRYHPDVIVVGLSDPMFQRLARSAMADSLLSKPFFELKKGSLRPASQPGEWILAAESVLNRSYLWLFFSRRIAALFGKRIWWEANEGKAELAEKIIERFAEVAKQEGATLVVFTINATYTLRSANQPEMNRVAEKASRSSRFHLLDLYPVLERSNYRALFYPKDGHYNLDGHIFVAEQLCKFLRARNIPPGTEETACEVDEEALHRSIGELRRCSMSGATEPLFPRGECIPRG